MIIPVLKRIVFKCDVDNITKIDDFVIPADADIGIEGEEGVQYFHFRLLTPKKLLMIISEDKIFNGRAAFIVNEIDMESNLRLVEIEINNILKQCIRETWEDVAKAINCYLDWEYDNN